MTEMRIQRLEREMGVKCGVNTPLPPRTELVKCIQLYIFTFLQLALLGLSLTLYILW